MLSKLCRHCDWVDNISVCHRPAVWHLLDCDNLPLTSVKLWSHPKLVWMLPRSYSGREYWWQYHRFRSWKAKKKTMDSVVIVTDSFFFLFSCSFHFWKLIILLNSEISFVFHKLCDIVGVCYLRHRVENLYHVVVVAVFQHLMTSDVLVVLWHPTISLYLSV